MLAIEWLDQAAAAMERIKATQLENIKQAAAPMVESIAADRWVHTFGCGHATIPVEEMYPRIGGFVGFHPIVELPLTFFTRIVGEMGVRQFVFLEGVEGYGDRIMEGYNFDPRDTMWIFSHSGINAVNIDVALRAKAIGMKLVVCGSEAGFRNTPARHSSGKKLFQLADVVVDNCTDAVDASVAVKNHQDKIGPVSTIAFVTIVWMIITTVAEELARRKVQLFIHPSHNVPGDTTAHERLDKALREYKKRIAGV
jgi:uncharacterized phosphosugar-binding protein